MNEHTPQPTGSLALPSAAKPVVEKIRRLIGDGRAGEALPCVAELDVFERYNPTVLNLTKGTILIDIANDLGDSECARCGAALIAKVDVTKLPESVRQAHWYNLGNGHSAIYKIKKIPSGVARALDNDFHRSKQYYREAMSAPAKAPESTARLYTNYGILLRTVGRHLEEIQAYDQALKAVPDHAMALWHKSKGLCWYSRLVERPTKRSALLEAWQLLKKALEAGLESGYQAKAERELAELERILKGPKPASDRHTQHVAASEIEKRYIRFCVDNGLYLHPCPVSSHQAYQDPLSVRFSTGIKNEYMEMRSNQLALIKQEYITARLLLFAHQSGIPDLSFVDRGTFLPAIGDVGGGIHVQLLNFSFRSAFAILDKLAYFLNGFCKLGQRPDSIYFREELFLSHGVLREGLAKYDGLQLAALVDLAREFSTHGSLFSLRDLRRKLEHRCVTVRRRPSPEKGSREATKTQPGGPRVMMSMKMSCTKTASACSERCERQYSTCSGSCAVPLSHPSLSFKQIRKLAATCEAARWVGEMRSREAMCQASNNNIYNCFNAVLEVDSPGQTLCLPRLAHQNDTMGTHETRGTNYF